MNSIKGISISYNFGLLKMSYNNNRGDLPADCHIIRNEHKYK